MKKTLIWTAVVLALITLPFVFLALKIVATIFEAVLWVAGVGMVIAVVGFILGRKTAATD